MRKVTLVSAVLALAVASVFAVEGQQAPPAQPAQGQTQGGRGQGRAGGAPGGRAQGDGQQSPPRDPQQTAPVRTASISGRVLTADTGRPVKRAQVMISGAGRGGRVVITDERGGYSVTGLTAGRFTVIASTNGFVESVY